MRYLLALALLGFTFGGVRPAAAGPGLNRCERLVAVGLGQCVAKAERCEACTAAGTPCGDCASVRADLLQRVANRVTKVCDAGMLQGLGFGPVATAQSVAARLTSECTAEVDSLYARTFGGPQAAVLTGATDATRSCLVAAHRAAASLSDKAFTTTSKCIRKTRIRGAGACSAAAVDAGIAAAQAKALAATTAACPDLKGLIGVDPSVYLDRVAAQSRCMLATSHGSTAPFDLDCGPRDATPVPPRGQWVQVVLDSNEWGTKCGDGSPYAFWLRLAPEGAPLNNMMVHLQGGGVCVFESDCAGVPASLFEAQSDYQPNGPTGGIFSTDSNVNPFYNYTMMALPYCTQDVHFGGGGTSVFSSKTVYRYGGVDVRASLRYLRDVVWAAEQQTTPEGYRPDAQNVLFVGESAGGFGVMYNYHYLLDDLQWSHTTGVPDSSLALDSHAGLSIALLGAALSGDTGQLGWGFRKLQPPYCIAGNCGLGPVLMAATAPRLKAVPEQQILNLSNQNDQTQVSTTFFPSTVAWMTEMRARYCDTQGLNGVHYFLPARTNPIHTMLSTESRYTGLTSNGVSVRDYLADAINDPDGVVDQVEEGTFTTDFGVPPIACLP